MAAPTTEISGNLLVIKDPDGTLITTLPDGSQTIDFFGAWNIARNATGDYYDFVGFFLDTLSGLPVGLGAASFSIYNDISGIGRSIYNNRPSFSTNKLSHIAYYGMSTPAGVPIFTVTETIHEIGHHWCAYVDFKDSGGTTQTLLHEDWVWNAGQQSAHWGRWPDDRNSCMDYDQAEWIDNGNGTFNRIQHDPTVDDAWFGYWALDQYLMGLIPASDVPSFPIVRNPSPAISWGPVGVSTGPYTPSPSALTINATNVVAEEGARSPDYLSSQRMFHELFVIITKSTAAASANSYVTMAEPWRVAHTDSFRRNTSGRAMIDTSLLRSNYSDLYVKDNAADTGGASSSGVFWLSPDLWVRNSQDGGLTDVPTIRGQDNYIYARVRNKGAQAYSNVVVNFYLANFEALVPGTEFFYPVNWAPAGLLGSATIAAVPAKSGGVDGEAITNIKWPASQIPPAAGWHPCLLTEVLPMEVTPTGLHHVWENKKLAQRNITIL